MDRTTKVEQFLTMLHEMNCNKVDGDADIEELFGPTAPFSVACNKCGSMKISITGEKGIDYGGYTGYSPGSTVVKCESCGAAATIWN